ncbi:MAG TPA: hypothetical protein VN028_04615 [Rhodocyclaceae bacterium]|nr:hypothetical protein [Rhodocyclaceae bacterium]
MKIAFSPLATVAPVHPYYKQGCRDIEFVPTSASADLLRAGRSIARMRDGALVLLYENDGPNTPLSSLAGRTLYFGLRLVNPYFVNFTAPVIAEPRLTPNYVNATQPDALDAPSGVTVTAGLHAHTATSAARPLDLVLRTPDNQALFTLTLAAGETTASFDLRNLAAGPCFIDEEQGGTLLQRHPLLVDADLRDYGVWGVLALTIDAGFYAAAPQFEIALSARKETLRYYVIADNFAPAEFDQLAVSDAGNNDNGSPIPFARILPPFPPGYIAKDLLAPGSTQIAVFQSQIEVERREQGLKKLRLSRNSTVLIEHLPLPGPEKPRADLIVHLSKP